VPPSTLQSVWLPEHVDAQTPAEHTVPVSHARPHPPQLALSVCVLAQYQLPPSPVLASPVPPPLVHIVCDAVHPATHAPALHVCPVAHAVPHAPQLAVSLCVSAQYAAVPEPHSVPVPHALTHLPATQSVAVGHVLPQAPQLEGSLARFAQ
jgi:hypothetical protein